MKLLYFSWVGERIGIDTEEIDPPSTVTTVADLATWLSARSPGHAEAFADPARLRAAVDLTMASWNAPIAGAREIAFFPPVTGG